MAGRRQHTIPRFLLKGFASRIHGSEVFVLMYRKGSKGFEVNIKNVGVEKDFYGKEDRSTDDQITAIEQQFSGLLDTLRAHPHAGLLGDDRIPKLIAHLCTRTRSLRQSMINSVDFLLGELDDHLRNKETLRTAVLDSSEVREKLRTELIARGVPKRQLNRTMALIKPHLLNAIMPDAIKTVDEIMSTARSVFPRALRDGHNATLARNPGAEKRAESYARFNWFVVVTKTPMVLGDTLCVFETSGKRWFKPLNEAGDDVQRIFLPLSKDRVLVGTPYSSCPKVDVQLLTKAIVRCSYEFFVSSAPLPSHLPLLSSIGQWAGVLSDRELHAVARNVS